MRLMPLLWLTICLWTAAASPASAQLLLQGEWVQASQQRIEEIRQSPLRVLVLDVNGRPVPNVEVTIRQQRHAFPFGVALTQPPPVERGPVWRCFNSAAVDVTGALAALRPEPGVARTDPVDAVVLHLPNGWTTRWGGVIPGDAARLPEWAAQLDHRPLSETLESHAASILRRYSGHVAHFDLYTHGGTGPLIEQRLGVAQVRRLFEAGRLHARGAGLWLRFEDALLGERLQPMLRRVAAMREAFVPFDGVAVESRVRAVLVQATLKRSLEWLAGLKVPIAIVGLEVGGPSPSAAAVNMETMLRTLFAEPAVVGIWFAGVSADALGDPNAALLDDAGNATPAGRALDDLVHGLWWTDLTLKADELGNVRARVYAGEHEIAATLPGGRATSMRVLVTGEQERIVILQPIAE